MASCGSSIGSGSCGQFCRKTAVDNLAVDNKIKIFPNPTSGNINIEFLSDLGTNKRIAIYDFTGRLLREEKIMGSKTSSIIQLPKKIWSIYNKA